MNVVVIGGGTGLSRILRGLKYLDHVQISAIVTISDDGGSTGFLSRHFQIPAVGDLRRVLGALSINREQLEESLEFRFANTNTALDGHSLGNLILLAEILRTKSFLKGINSASRMLNVCGEVIPVSDATNAINARFTDGTCARGESAFYKHNKSIEEVFFNEDSNAKANPQAVRKILAADFIVIGIGSLYTSILPNLIYPEIVAALKKTKAPVIYFGNITTEKGETDGMDLQDHIDAIEQHTFKDLIKIVVVNSTPIPAPIVEIYRASGQTIIKNELRNENAKIFKGNLLTFENDIIRHDPILIQKIFERLLRQGDLHTTD